MTKLNPFRSANKVRNYNIFFWENDYWKKFGVFFHEVWIYVFPLQHEKQADSDDEDPPVSSEKSSGNKQVL